MCRLEGSSEVICSNSLRARPTLRSALASWGLKVSEDGLSNSSKLDCPHRDTFLLCVKQSLS